MNSLKAEFFVPGIKRRNKKLKKKNTWHTIAALQMEQAM